MRNKIVNTSNTAKFLAAMGALQNRGAEEACLLVVDGEPGLGKSRTIEWWAVQQDAVFVRAKQEWTPRWAVGEILESLGETPAHAFEARYRQALEALDKRARSAELGDRTFAVVVDEADHISRRPRILESLRDLSDMLEVPFVMVGMGRIRHNLKRFPQVMSRVSQLVEFKPASREDVAALVAGLCETDVKEDLVAFLHRASEGYVREIKEGIKAIERFAVRNPGAIGCAEMGGQVLMNDRRTGRPIMVPRA